MPHPARCWADPLDVWCGSPYGVYRVVPSYVVDDVSVAVTKRREIDDLDNSKSRMPSITRTLAMIAADRHHRAFQFARRPDDDLLRLMY